MMRRKRKGLSEIISVITTLLIVSTTGVILYNISLEMTSAQQNSLKYELDRATAEAQERFNIISLVKQNQNTIEITVFNYGKIDINVSDIYINGTRTNYYIEYEPEINLDIAKIENIIINDDNFNFRNGDIYNILVVSGRGVESAYLWKIPVPGP